MKRFDREYQLLAKKANQRMVELEKRGLTRGFAYEEVQAKLEQLGRTAKTAAGRRFTETGKGSFNEIEAAKKALKRFLESKTSTVTGQKQFIKNVLDAGEKQFQYKEHGLTDQQYLQIWENLPQNENERLYYATTIVQMVEAHYRENPSSNYSVKDLISIIQSSQSFSNALDSIGVSLSAFDSIGGIE